MQNGLIEHGLHEPSFREHIAAAGQIFNNRLPLLQYGVEIQAELRPTNVRVHSLKEVLNRFRLASARKHVPIIDFLWYPLLHEVWQVAGLAHNIREIEHLLAD